MAEPRRKTATVLRLVPPPARPVVDQMTVDTLRGLLYEAQDGKLVGIAYAAMYTDREWDYLSTGEAHRNPVWALGMLHAFAADLTDRINDT